MNSDVVMTLLQEPTEPRDEGAPERGHVVVKLLGRLAKQQQSPVLAQLATGLIQWNPASYLLDFTRREGLIHH